MTIGGGNVLHISICDDEPQIARKMEQIILREMNRINITADIDLFSNGEEFLTQYTIRDDELIFLDIDMPVKTGIDVIRELERLEKNRNIIVITNHDHLVLESVSYCPFQIIRKMNMEEDIPKAVDRYVKSRKRNAGIIEFSGKGYAHHVNVESIRYLEKYRNHIIVYLADGHFFRIRGNLKEYEIQLSGNGFTRVHTGYIINLLYASSIEKNEVILDGGLRIPISREKLKIVKEQFMISRRY